MQAGACSPVRRTSIAREPTLDITTSQPSPSRATDHVAWKASDWKRLLDRIRDGDVVPVLGPQLLVEADGHTSRQAGIADALLRDHGLEVEHGSLPAFRELNEAFTRLKDKVRPQDIYADVHDLIRNDSLASGAAAPTPIQQIAQISDFRLWVTLTPDDWLARSLRQRCAVNEIVHSPRWPTSEGKDLPPDWHQRAGEVQLLYLFGKSRTIPTFAIHDEDILEYAHNIIARGSQVPGAFLGELQERSLLLIGCNFPDWLSRFFLRLTNKSRLSEKGKREWMVEQLAPQESLTCFLRSYSKETEVLSDLPPAQFVAELHRRWLEDRGGGDSMTPPAGDERAPGGAMFFVSYSRVGDLPRAETLVRRLIGLGAAEAEVWFDRRSIEPGHDFRNQILDGIRGCRYFVPLLSDKANGREEAFVFSEWREANDRLSRMNREFVFPVIVDPEYDPGRYTADPVRSWRGIDFGHAPQGEPDARLLAKFKKLLRDARRPAEA